MLKKKLHLAICFYSKYLILILVYSLALTSDVLIVNIYIDVIVDVIGWILLRTKWGLSDSNWRLVSDWLNQSPVSTIIQLAVLSSGQLGFE